LSNFLL
jgi:CTD small phosphatase-like protein 2